MKENSYVFSDLSVDQHTIEMFMGFEKDNAPSPFPEIIKGVLDKADDLPNIRGGYTIFSPAILDPDKKILVLQEKLLHVKKMIGAELSGISSAAIFLCTAGKEIQEWSKNLLDESDPITSYIVDVLGSEIAENVAEKIHNEVEQAMSTNGLSVTTRFSPGYCGWEVSDQHTIFSLLPENYCKIRLTDSALMNPIKSISGIIGIGKEVRNRQYPCDFCDRKDCIYRNLRETA